MGKETDNSRKNAIEDRPFWLDPINSRVMPLEMEIKMMEKNRRKEKKKDGKDKKKKDKDKNDRERSREHQVSDNESKKCGLKGLEHVKSTREQRKRNPTKKYNSSEYTTDDSWEDSEFFESKFITKNDANLNCLSDSRIESEVKESVEKIMASDIGTKPFEGFTDETLDEETKTMYQMHISDAEEYLEPTIKNEDYSTRDLDIPENFYEQHDFIYLSELNIKTEIPKEWRGAKKVAALLRKSYGGNPTVVRPMPRWLSLKLDRWGLRRHEVDLVTEPWKLKNKRIYTEEEMDSQYPLNQDDQNRYKRLKFMLNHLPQTQISHNIHKVSGSSHSRTVKRRRDTVEKNLDKMFNGDQENDSDTFNPKRTKTEIGNGTIEETELFPALSSSIQEPFHGFKENETGEETLVNDVSLHNANKELKHGRTIISTLTPKLIHIDDKGNTFGMTSVYASPISDFNSDYDDEFSEPSTMEKISCTQADKRLPISVEMNYPMVQYLIQALQKEDDALKELNRIMGLSNSTNLSFEEARHPQVEIRRGVKNLLD